MVTAAFLETSRGSRGLQNILRVLSGFQGCSRSFQGVLGGLAAFSGSHSVFHGHSRNYKGISGVPIGFQVVVGVL